MTNLHFQIGEKSDGRVDMFFSASFYRDVNMSGCPKVDKSDCSKESKRVLMFGRRRRIMKE